VHRTFASQFVRDWSALAVSRLVQLLLLLLLLLIIIHNLKIMAQRQ